MNTLNPLPLSAKSNNFQYQFIPSVLTQQPLNSFSFKTPFPLSIKLSKTPNSKPFKSLIPLSFLKPTLISTITATALFFTGFYFNPKQAICCPVSPVPTVDTNVKEEVLEQEETEKAPENVEILRNLLENRVKNRELDDALSIINKLIELEPDEIEWRFLKSHLYVHNGEIELAKLGFRDVILKDPYYVEAYRGLVVAASEDESMEEMKKIEKQVMEGINMCEKEEKESELRDLKLILAQIWVIGGKYDEALKVYQELVDEEPGDFRPYLCQGMIYTALKKNDEAEKYFEKYRGLVPQDHTNARFEFMMAT
ncbi:hypothetical protein KY289_007177 [Solanum tuberosum]|nr:hypothetical protein KY289_007177 [Solanum tuberosum]